jgi:hypothetical protein
MKFSHQTFAEFLSAWYLDYREIPDKTVIKIIGEKYLYPQLYETSAWVASRRESIFRHLMNLVPLILLRSDVMKKTSSFFHGFTKKLKVADLPLALEWVKDKISQGSQIIVENVAREILIKAWDNIDSPEILSKFVEVAKVFIRTHKDCQIARSGSCCCQSRSLKPSH